MDGMKEAMAQIIAATRFAEAEPEQRLRTKMLRIREVAQSALDLREGNVPLADEDVWGADEPTEGGRR